VAGLCGELFQKYWTNFRALNSIPRHDIGIAAFNAGDDMSTIQLYKEHPDTYKREILGIITQAQLTFLMDNLDEEFEEDEEYYLFPEMIDDLKTQGADSNLIALLEKALTGTPEGTDIFYMIE
jgi:hypothetical protein